MITVTVFEHQFIPYEQLASVKDLREKLLKLNEANGKDIILLESRGIRAQQFVGVIRLGDVSLQILPKIDWDGNSDAGTPAFKLAEQSATNNLVQMLSYAGSIPFNAKNRALLDKRPADWFELLTRFFAIELHEQMRRGIEHQYVREDDRLPTIRGRWRIDQHVIRPPHERLKFDVSYDDFQINTPLNRIFRFVVDRLWLISRDNINRRLLSDLRDWLLQVPQQFKVSAEQLEEIAFTRLNERFEPAFNLARLFVEGQTPNLTVSDAELFAFIFDMNVLFEQFVLGFLRRYRSYILPLGLRIESQGGKRQIHLAQAQPGETNVFRLKPDIMLTSLEGHPRLIIDTKYKRLKPGRVDKGVSEADAYQMLAYLQRLGCESGILLYPQPNYTNSVSQVFALSGESNQRIFIASINLHASLQNPETMMQHLHSEITYALMGRRSYG